MQLNEFHRLVDETLPPAAAMRGDAIGLQVDSRRGTAHRVLVALEVTDDVLHEATVQQCDCILAFHPLIYSPLSTLTRTDRVGRLVAGLIEQDIALVIVHTAFDAFPQGTNYVLAEHLGFTVVGPLVEGEIPGYGMGVRATVEPSLSMDDLVQRVTDTCGSPVRFLSGPSTTVTTVAIVGGSGISFYPEAVAAGVDVFITADVKYHAFHAADGVIGLIDPGHFEMERFVPEGLISVLAPRLESTTELVCSSVNTNPVRYSSPLPKEHSSFQ